MHRCKYYASKHLQVSFQRFRLCQDSTKVFAVENIYQQEVNITGSFNLYIIHPGTRCVEEIPFFVVSNEGSMLISCATSLALGLTKPHDKLDHPPPEGNRNVIYSSADKIKKKYESQLNIHQLVRNPKLTTKIQHAHGQKMIDHPSMTDQDIT